MKGLEISRRFAGEWLMPFIDQELPGLRAHIAVGRFMGSEVLDADDRLSQDHNWGATLEVYLDDDYAIRDAELAARLNSAAPAEFLGMQRHGGYDTAVTLRRTHGFVKSVLGGLPGTPAEWLCCGARFEEIESFLYFFRHGALFHDGSGQLSALRRRFHAYPEDIQRLRLASCFYDIAHYGEYNFVWRLAERNDILAMQMALGYFCRAVLRLFFYLDGDFAPYWKWLPHEFRRRGYAPPIDAALLRLPGLPAKKQALAIQALCTELKERVFDAGLVPREIANPYNMPWFFRFRDEILKGISEPRIRNLTY